MAKSKKKITPKAASNPSSAKKASKKVSSNPGPWKTPLTHLGLILGFLVITFAYFSPILGGKVISQHDIYHTRGMSKDVQNYLEKNNPEEPVLWTNGMFGGMPTFQIGSPYPNNLIRPLDQFIHFGIPQPVKYILLMFIGLYFLLWVLKLDPWLCAIGGLAFAFSSYFFIIMAPGHTSKANAISYMPFVIGGILMAYQGKDRILLGAAITMLAVALELNANHFQVTYYLLIPIAALIIAYGVDAILKKNLPIFLKASGALAIAALLAIGPNMSRILTTYEYADVTMRGKAELTEAAEGRASGLDIEYALRWSYGKAETLSLLIPNVYGGSSGGKLPTSSETYKLLETMQGAKNAEKTVERWPTYWGDQPGTSGPVYVGAIIFFLFILSLFVVRGPLLWGLLAATLLSIFLSWGRNWMDLTEFLFANLPIYNKFRAPSITLIIAELCIPILGLLALHKVVQAKTPEERASLIKPLYIATGITAGLCVLLALVGDLFFDFTTETAYNSDTKTFTRMIGDAKQAGTFVSALITDRFSLLRMDALRSALLIIIAAGLMWGYLKSKVKLVYVMAAVGILTLGDLWTINKRYLNDNNFEEKRKVSNKSRATAADKEILKDKDPHYRVLNFTTDTYNEAATSYHHKSIGGYHAAKFRRYQDMINRHIQREMGMMQSALQGLTSQDDSTMRARFSPMRTLNMLNTKYFILGEPGKEVPVKNPAAMGNGWFVSNLQKVNSADEEIAALNTLDPRTTAVVDTHFEHFKEQIEGFSPVQDPSASVKLTAYAPHKISYETNASQKGLAVFSEVYYNDGKGWQAYLNGQKVSHLRV
ncbi:hypothetical protein N9933_01450, partial [bacterium]|nr:hypothetical protein [bacterium]